MSTLEAFRHLLWTAARVLPSTELHPTSNCKLHQIISNCKSSNKVDASEPGGTSFFQVVVETCGACCSSGLVMANAVVLRSRTSGGQRKIDSKNEGWSVNQKPVVSVVLFGVTLEIEGEGAQSTHAFFCCKSSGRHFQDTSS